MDLETHILTSLEHFGNEYREVHEFLDQYFRYYHMLHRAIFHHGRGLDVIEDKWGWEARTAAEFHIMEDTGGFVPPSWKYYYSEPEFKGLHGHTAIEKILRQYYSEFEPPTVLIGGW